jgi:pimeloyl-ACP methyl ester carboxylesterase
MTSRSDDLPLLTPERRAALAEPGPAHDLPLWREAFAGYDWMLLRTSAVYYGFGTPRGDSSAVVTVPGFLGTDTYLVELRGWLGRIGYRPYHSQIGRNADCPNLIVRRLLATVERAGDDTGQRVHLIGHSLGGIIARSAASIAPERIASVTSLGSPFRGIRSHPIVLHTRDVVRRFIFGRPSSQYLPAECYTGHCSCEFLDGLTRFPSEVAELAIYSRRDGVVDWRMCVTGDPRKDREVLGTHVGMAFNPFVYRLVAEFLAGRARPATPLRPGCPLPD